MSPLCPQLAKEELYQIATGIVDREPIYLAALDQFSRSADWNRLVDTLRVIAAANGTTGWSPFFPRTLLLVLT